MEEIDKSTDAIWVSIGVTKKLKGYEFIRIDAGARLGGASPHDKKEWEKVWQEVEDQISDQIDSLDDAMG